MKNAPKAKWAADLAAEFRKTSSSLRYKSSRGSYSRAARKGESMRYLDEQALRLERIAAHYRGHEAPDDELYADPF